MSAQLDLLALGLALLGVGVVLLNLRVSALEKEVRKGITVTIERTVKVVAQECSDDQP